jgi:hypothetical protein
MFRMIRVPPSLDKFFGILRTFGERQMMAQLIAGRWPFSLLIHKVFRGRHPLLTEGNFAATHLNHQNRARASALYSSVYYTYSMRIICIYALCMGRTEAPGEPPQARD